MMVSISFGPIPPPVAYRMTTGAARAIRTSGIPSAAVPAAADVTKARRARGPVIFMFFSCCRLFGQGWTWQAARFRRSSRHGLDFDQHARMRQGRYSHQGARRRALVAEIPCRDLIENVLAVHVGRKNGQLEDVRHARAGGVHDLL